MNQTVVDAVKKRLEGHYGIKLFRPFLRDYHYARTERDLKPLLEYQHLIHFLLDESPNKGTDLVYLFLTRNKGNNQCLYISIKQGKFNIESTVHRFDRSVHQNDTLFVGYRLGDIYLITDVLIYENQVCNRDIDQRIRLCNEIIDNEYIHDPIMSSELIKVQEYIEYDFIHSFWTIYRTTLPKRYQEAIKGLVFAPLGNNINYIIVNPDTEITSVCSNTKLVKDESAKESSRINTSRSWCFLVKPTERSDVYNLYLRCPSRHGELIKYDIANVPDREISTMLRKQVGEKGIVMVCYYDQQFSRWTPKCKTQRKNPDYMVSY